MTRARDSTGQIVLNWLEIGGLTLQFVASKEFRDLTFIRKMKKKRKVKIIRQIEEKKHSGRI